MKKIVIASAVTLLATQSFATTVSEMRDASFKASTNAGNVITDKGQSTVDATVKVADMTAGRLKEILSKSLKGSTQTSEKIGEKIVKLAEISQPVFQLTSDGLAVVFDASADAGRASLKATEKLIILLAPASKMTKKEISDLLSKLIDISEPSTQASLELLVKAFDKIGEGIDVSSEVSIKVINELYRIFKKPIDLSAQGTEDLARLIFEGSKATSKIANAVIGKENIEGSFRLSGKGISLTSEGISAAFYFLTKASSGLTNFFNLNREEIEKAVERNDQDTLAGLRELIRSEINKTVENGETLNLLLSDADLDFYIEARLEAMNG